MLKDFNIPINEYIRRCEKQIQEWDDQEQNLLSDKKLVCKKSVEYASRIILSMVTGKEDLIYGVDTIENLQYARGKINALESLLQDINDLLKKEDKI